MWFPKRYPHFKRCRYFAAPISARVHLSLARPPLASAALTISSATRSISRCASAPSRPEDCVACTIASEQPARADLGSAGRHVTAEEVAVGGGQMEQRLERRQRTAQHRWRRDREEDREESRGARVCRAAGRSF